MPKIRDFDRVTALYERLSKDDEQQGESNSIKQLSLTMPKSVEEQKAISAFFMNLDHLITLHQCEPTFNKWRISMLNNINKTDLFYEYYAQWITVYKEGAIRKVTMDKYLLTLSWIKQLAPDLKVGELSRITYQQLLNDYAEKHERQTTMDFHHQIKGAMFSDTQTVTRRLRSFELTEWWT